MQGLSCRQPGAEQGAEAPQLPVLRCPCLCHRSWPASHIRPCPAPPALCPPCCCSKTSLSATASFEVRSPKLLQVSFEEGRVATPQLLADLTLPTSLDILGQQVDLAPLQVGQPRRMPAGLPACMLRMPLLVVVLPSYCCIKPPCSWCWHSGAAHSSPVSFACCPPCLVLQAALQPVEGPLRSALGALGDLLAGVPDLRIPISSPQASSWLLNTYLGQPARCDGWSALVAALELCCAVLCWHAACLPVCAWPCRLHALPMC